MHQAIPTKAITLVVHGGLVQPQLTAEEAAELGGQLLTAAGRVHLPPQLMADMKALKALMEARVQASRALESDHATLRTIDNLCRLLGVTL